ncbi:MAG: DUF4494 domain-containing protein [Tunicatimonas sp.]
MATWFICKVKYQKQDEKGRAKNVSEQYLVDALSFTEAEARIYEKLGSVISGEFFINNISKSNLTDVFYYEDADVWYKCKMTYALEVEGSGKEKKVVNYVLLTAANAKQAYERVYESLNNMLVEFQVPDVVESPIVEVFPADREEDATQEAPDNWRPLEEADADRSA